MKRRKKQKKTKKENEEEEEKQTQIRARAPTSRQELPQRKRQPSAQLPRPPLHVPRRDSDYNPNTGSQISKQRILISLEAHPGVLNSSLILRGPFLASSYSLPWD